MCEQPHVDVLLGSRLALLLEECLLAATLTELNGGPEKYSENLSDSSALTSMIQVLQQKHWTIVDPELSALHKQWRHPTNLKNVPKESSSHFCNQSSLLEGRLSHIFMSFVFPSAEADTFSSAFDFWEIVGFSLFDASEVIFKFWVPTRSGGDNCAC